MRDGAPFALAAAALAVSFGVLAREAGLSALAAIVMSATVYAGSAQFAALAILVAGGSAGAAVLAGTLANARFLPMGAAFASAVRGPLAWRALQGQAVVDASWAMALRPGGRFDREYLLGHSSVQYVGWLAGTTLGALGAHLVDPAALGLDAVFPAFFVAMLASELRDGPGLSVAAGGAVVALAAVPVAPPGVAIVLASAVALLGLHPRMRRRR